MTSFVDDVVGSSPAQSEIKNIIDSLLADVDKMSIKSIPGKSCLKRRLHNDDSSVTPHHTPNKSPKIAKHVTFSKLVVFWFERAQGKCSIPTFGGLPLGMCQKDCGMSEFKDFKSFESYMRRHKIKLNKQRWQRFTATQNELKTSRSRRNTTTSVIYGEDCPDAGASNIDKRIADDEMRRYTTDNKSFIRMPSNVRRNIFESLEVKINEEDEKDTHKIRENRKSVGCDCEGGICLPTTCSCSVNGIQCYIDVYGNPTCGCDRDKCRNPEGVIEYKEDIVRCHYDFIKEKEVISKEIEGCYDEKLKERMSEKLHTLTRDYALRMLQLKQSPIKESQYNPPKQMSFELQISARDFLFDSKVQYNDDSDTELCHFSKMPSLIANQS